MEGTSIIDIYRRLFAAYGPQGWWPAGGPFEMIVGAILTQATSWENAEAAIDALRRAGLLSSRRMMGAPVDRIASLIRPAVYYNQKALKLRAFLDFLADRYGGDLDRLLEEPLPELREHLLSIRGIGPETADSIVLYAAKKPSFVVDAYTKRLLTRLSLVDPNAGYDGIRALFTSALPADAELFGEYHALIVRHCKEHCRAEPVCGGCPLGEVCPSSGLSRSVSGSAPEESRAG